MARVRGDFAGLRSPSTDEERKGTWAQSKRAGGVPWATSGDYNGDGLSDLALILVDAKGGERLWKVVALLQTDNHAYESVELKRFHEVTAGPGHLKAGKTLPPPPPQEFVLRTVSSRSKPEAGWLGPYRFDAIELTTASRPDPGEPFGMLWTWRPQTGAFSSVAFGGMGD
jgi:hypothetical protein